MTEDVKKTNWSERRGAPKWFRMFKKIFTNVENTAIAILAIQGYAQDSAVILFIKIGTSAVLENLETILSREDGGGGSASWRRKREPEPQA